jgi:L-asparaginase/Glu-tRNA(Gln) amidotransferase subunit D
MAPWISHEARSSSANSESGTDRIVPLYANNLDLLEMGAVQADNLSPCRVLLMVAMTHTSNPDELRTYFNR